MAHPPINLTAQGNQGLIEDIHAFRKKVVAAIEGKDAIALRKIYADGFTHTHTSSKMDGKDARIVSAIAGDPVIENAPVNDLVVKIYAGGWAAVATGASPIKSMADGKTYAVHWTVTYAKSGEDWQIVASHATRGKEMTQ
jgi:ketosteroid isomerase-like protein